MALFQIFLGRVPPLLAYRTEWSIWADEEQVAGMIVFVALDLDGHLVCLGYTRALLSRLLPFEPCFGVAGFLPCPVFNQGCLIGSEPKVCLASSTTRAMHSTNL